VRVDERDDHAAARSLERTGDLDTPRLECSRGEPAGLIGRSLADESRLGAQCSDPGGDIRAWPPAAICVRAVTSAPCTSSRSSLTTTSSRRSPKQQTSIAYDPGMDEERGRRGRLRSFVIGGLLGASAVIATGRRPGRRRGSRETPAGLAAFESAPCYRELVEHESTELESPP
jgi:hypothetical protein